MALTDIQIRKASPKDKDYKLSDSGGLHLLVKATGSKLWRLAYRYSGKQKTLAFGPYPLLTLAEVREKAFFAKKKLLDGIDPGEEKRMEKITKKISASNSFESIAMKWFEYWGKQKSPRHADYVLRRLQMDVFPQIGHRPIGEIKSRPTKSRQVSTTRRLPLSQLMSAVTCVGIDKTLEIVKSLRYCTFEQYYIAYDSFAGFIRFANSSNFVPNVDGSLWLVSVRWVWLSSS